MTGSDFCVEMLQHAVRKAGEGQVDQPRFLAADTLQGFSVETVELLREGRGRLAAANVVLNGLGGPLMAWLGWRLS